MHVQVPTVYDFNVEEVAYKDLVLVCWDTGGPDGFRPYMPATCDPASVDALVFVVDAVRLRHEPAYREQARRELWRHLEGDILTETIQEHESMLRQTLQHHPGPEDEEEPWRALPLGANEMYLGPVQQSGIPPENDVIHYLPRPENQTRINADGSQAHGPTPAGLWLRHVRKILVVANKCEGQDRASVAEVPETQTPMSRLSLARARSLSLSLRYMVC